MSYVMAGTAATLFGLGTYLLLQRKLSRIIIGLSLLSHGANVLFVNSGRSGVAPFVGKGDAADMADPIPQALVLTAIVISFATTTLLLALAYRSWLLTDDDEVDDDVEDGVIGRHGHLDTEVSDEAALAAAVSVAAEEELPDGHEPEVVP